MRDPEYQFVDAGVDELAASLVREYERLAGTTVQPGSPERVIIQWAAGIIVHERVLMNYIGSQNIPSRADGENLDALAELMYLPKRPQAAAAVCTQRFYISEPQKSAILVPKGTRVTSSGGPICGSTCGSCHGSCGTGCTSTASSCSGCSGGCHSCSGCSGACGSNCDGICAGCGNCGSSCASSCGGCTSCTGGCGSVCEGCATTCSGCDSCTGCYGCSGCGSSCASSCYGCSGCSSCSGCANGCGTGCRSGCKSSCSTACSTTCYSTCSNQCCAHCLKCIDRRTQSTDECFDCPIAEGCAWCSAYNYQVFGTADRRATFICVMHRARALANAYYWNRLYRKQNLKKRFKIHVPEEWALEILGQTEWDMLRELEE